MSTTADTLKKILYDNLEQFVEDINHNFAVFKNSPLYKGIPGESAVGITGLQGTRGNKFIFVYFDKFQTQFPNEFVNASAINLNYINNKLLNFADKQKLLTALQVTELVDKDIVILTNSVMLTYDINENKFLSTNIAFNAQTNLISTIEQQIEYYVQYYINNNQTIIGLKNIFESYSTYAKNYSDTSNVYITNQQTASSVYVPYYPGLTTNTNGTLVNHKYFGLNDNEFSRNGNGTIVFGSIKKYIDLLTATVSLSDGVTLTSDYAPGASNNPIAVFLQDTSNSGLLIGRKIKSNLSSFANIYKNSLDELVIKSDSGPDTINNVPSTDFSRLVIGKTKLSFDKPVNLFSDLSVGGNARFVGDVDNKYFRTGIYADPDNPDMDLLLLGAYGRDSIITILSETINYSRYTNNVLVTSNGELSKLYSLENTQINAGQEVAFTTISPIISSPTKIPTSNYLGFLMKKINNITTKISNDYWTKLAFVDDTIPALKLNNYLTVAKNTILGGNNLSNMFSVDADLNKVTIGKNSTSKTNITGEISLLNVINNVLVTNNDGKILSTYKLTDKTISGTVPDSYGVVPTDTVENELLIPDNVGSRVETDIISAYQISWIIKLANSIKTRLKNTFNKTESDIRYFKNTSLSSLGSKLVYYAKFNGYGVPSVISSKSNLSGYGVNISRPNGGTGDYKIYFKNIQNEVLQLSNNYVLGNCVDGGNTGEKTVSVRKCGIVAMTSPSNVQNGQIDITTADDASANDCIFEIFIYEFLM